MNQSFLIGAKDSSNNTRTENVMLSISTPTIQIDDIIQDNLIPGGLHIISSLSRGMDEGKVKFERKRNNVRTTLLNTQVATGSVFDYPLGFDQTLIS